MTAQLIAKIETLERQVGGLGQTVEALRASEQRWRTLLQKLPDFIAIVDRELKLEFVNTTLPDYGVEQVIGTSILEYVSPEYHAVIAEGNERVFQTGIPERFEIQGVGPNGTTAWYVSRLVPIKSDDRVASVVHVATDITQRKHAQRRFRHLFENAPLCMFELDLEQPTPAIRAANRRAAQIYGWSAEEFPSVPMERIVPPQEEARVGQLIAQVRAGHTVTFETTHLRRDGTSFPARVRVAPQAAPDFGRIVITVEDISAEKQRRSDLEAIDRERRRLAHEIHDVMAQNLAALRLRAALWHDLVDTNPAQMHAELDYLLEVLKADIHAARRAIFALRPVALDELGFVPAVRQFIDKVCQHYEVCPEVRVTGPAERLPTTLELPLFRILQESLNNIGKHAQADNVWIDLDLESTHAVSLTVRDDGVGFDPGTTTRGVREGHMGLQHIRERVESINGLLSVKSQPGQGTEIRVTLPIAEA